MTPGAETWSSPATVSDLVAKRIDAYKRDHDGERPARWRVEIGPRFRDHLRRHSVRDVPGWVEGPNDDGWLLWFIPVVRVDGPEGWRLMEQP